jgi:DNA polymerase-3 subunit delta
MKLEATQIGRFLRDPGSVRVILLFGDDVGMIRERADQVTRAVAGSLDDPFQVVELEREDVGRLADESISLALTGGRRVVRLRETPDTASISTIVQGILRDNGTNLIVLEAAGIAARGRLRTVLEAAPNAVAIGCYPEEGRALEETIRHSLAEARVGIDPDAMGWLSGQLGVDRASTRSELEKLALYVGVGRRVDVDSAMACVGDLAGLSLDDALYAAMVGDIATADRALRRALAEGAAPIQIIRAAMGHWERLRQCRTAVDAGEKPGEVVRSLRPPLFFRRVGPFTRGLSLWPSPAILAALRMLWDVEKDCKRTGYPDETLCMVVIFTLGRRAATMRQR